MNGCVYFLREGADGPIKIGYTSQSAQSRLSGCQTGSSKPLNLMAVIKHDEALHLERHFHRHFHDAHIRGEWFWPVKSLLGEINRAANGYETNAERAFNSRFG